MLNFGSSHLERAQINRREKHINPSKMLVSLWRTVKFLILLTCLCESALTPEVKKVYSGFLSGKGLYNDDDDVVILNISNFKSKVYGSGNSWLVEFYNSWCGHCHKFAPIWKSLAASLVEWKEVIQLGAIDCARDEHTSLCRDYEIMAYPTMKFFSARSPSTNLGIELVRTSQTEKDITREVVGILQKEQLEGRGNHWPILVPYRSYDPTNLWAYSQAMKFIFLIFADENDPLPTEVILDLSSVEDVEIRGVVADNEILSRILGVHSYPTLLVWEKPNKEPKFLKPKDSTRESFRVEIKKFLQSKGFTVPKEPRQIKMLSPQEIPSMAELQSARDNLVKLQKIRELGDLVFLIDLENTLRYSLEHEVSSRKRITGEDLIALNKYLAVLSKYFPMSRKGLFFMEKLRDTVLMESEITGLKFASYLSNLTSGGLSAALSTNDEWMGCKGSENHYRGYPCGLWTLFHYMTVNALRDTKKELFDPLEVLNAMAGYIKYFFGCTQCSKHFQTMVVNKTMSRVKNGEQAVLWLWVAHNEVNKRLANDESEDPEFPKVQFPTKDRCHNCRSLDGNWVQENVLEYLKSVYDQENLNQMGSDSKLHFRNESPIDEMNSKSEVFIEKDPKKLGKEFNIFDLSFCVTLYMFSAIICVLVCLKFILKKRLRRRSHGHDLLGKV